MTVKSLKESSDFEPCPLVTRKGYLDIVQYGKVFLESKGVTSSVYTHVALCTVC